ncbi:MAG: Rossmann-like and DUF2520 domain-containing protein [Bacteroidales bacterium]
MINKLVLIGAGNVATHIGQALFEQGVEIVQVYSRSLVSAKPLSELLKAEAITDISKVQEADAYLFAVKDDAIADLVGAFPFSDRIMLHTAGSVDMEVFSQKTSDYGVVYPLQTFSKQRAVDMTKVPFCLETSNSYLAKVLEVWIRKISSSVQFLSKEQRASVHLAAVFACNFSNYMYTVAEDFLQNQQLDFSLLRPLVLETARKVTHHLPSQVQTGPAIRSDEKILQKHLHELSDTPEWQNLYRFVSDSIEKRHKKS